MPTNDIQPRQTRPTPTRDDVLRLREERRRIALRKRKRQRTVFISGIAAVIILVIIVILSCKGCSGRTDVLAGTWNLDGTTTYEFDGNGTGAMVLPSISYDFTYTINGDRLVIDFANEILQDSTYTFSVEDGTLTMIGSEGTVGGTYTLTKEK